MSFYGSVYYQLVDTFYKIVAKNSSVRTFGPTEYPIEDLETQAIGRKGILSLNAGNRWFVFDQIKADASVPLDQFTDKKRRLVKIMKLLGGGRRLGGTVDLLQIRKGRRGNHGANGGAHGA